MSRPTYKESPDRPHRMGDSARERGAHRGHRRHADAPAAVRRACLGLLAAVLVLDPLAHARTQEPPQAVREARAAAVVPELLAASSPTGGDADRSLDLLDPALRSSIGDQALLAFLASLHTRRPGLELLGVRATDGSSVEAWCASPDSDEAVVLELELEDSPAARPRSMRVRVARRRDWMPGLRWGLSLTEGVQLLEAWVAGQAASGQFSGVVLLTRHAQGPPLLRRAFGSADLAHDTPCEETTRFNTASLTKLFTAVLVLQQVESRELELDMPVCDALPEELAARVPRDVTVRHLLSHTAGLEDSLEEVHDTPERPIRTWHDALPALRLRTLGPPGGAFSYSSDGYVLLGAMLEHISGKPWATLIGERITAPAGLLATGPVCLDEPQSDLATGYTRHEDGRLLQSTRQLLARSSFGGTAASPAGSLYSTVDDLHAFVEGLRGGTLLGAEALALMLTPETDTPYGPHVRWGLGAMLEERGESVESWGHTGGTAGMEALLVVYAEPGLTAVVLANRDGVVEAFAERLRDVVVRLAEDP